MGRIEVCVLCTMPVLELDGQFEVLQPYDGRADDPAFEIVGTCHSTCLAASEHHPKWVNWMLGGFLRRGYERVGTAEGWQVLSMARTDDAVAVHETGCTVGFKRAMLKKGKRCDGGLLIPVRNEMYYELDEVELVASWQNQLSTSGSIALERVVQDLGIADRMRWPVALRGGRWVHSKRTRATWGPGQIGAIGEYNVFVPDAESETVQGVRSASSS
jgi:hypothetical protein